MAERGGILRFRNLQLGPETEDLLLQSGHDRGVRREFRDAPEFVGVQLQVEQLPVVHVGRVEVDEFVAIGHDAVVGVDVVRDRVFVVLVVETRPPVGRAFSLEDRNEAVPLHVGRNGQALCLHRVDFNASRFQSLRFWIHGGATGGQQLQAVGIVGDANKSAYSLGTLPANTWKEFVVPLASLVGFENLPPKDLADLFEYMAASKVKP